MSSQGKNDPNQEQQEEPDDFREENYENFDENLPLENETEDDFNAYMKEEETEYKITHKEYFQSLFKNRHLVVQEGPTPQFSFKEIEIPQAKEDEELIRVVSAGLNRADLLQCQGKYPPPEGVTNVLGLEAAGFKARKFGTFDPETKWMALLPGGGFQQYIAINKQLLMDIPQSIDIADAGGLPEIFMASYLHLKQLAQIKKNDNVLIYAGASGVGTASIQLTKLFGGNPYVLVSNKEKLEFCERVGASYGLAYNKLSQQEIIEKFKNETKNKGFDIILDCVGPSYFNLSSQLASQDCRWLLYGILSGAKTDQLNLAQFLQKRIQLICTTLRNRSDEFKYQLTKNFKEDVLPYFDQPAENKVQLKLHMDHRVMINWNERAIIKIQDAHDYMKNNENMGKMVFFFPFV